MGDAPEHVPPLDLATFRTEARKIAKARRDAVDAIVTQIDLAAEAEGVYQKAKVTAWATLKKANKTATEAAAVLKGQPDVVTAQKDRDIQRDLIKVGYARLDTLDAERATLHRIAEWSMKINPQGE
jgi:hypothetical protein